MPALRLDAAPMAARDLAAALDALAPQAPVTATLALSPPALGRLWVAVERLGERLDARFLVERAGAREALEAALPELRGALAASGLVLGQASVALAPTASAPPGAGMAAEGQALAQSGGQAAAGSGGGAAGQAAGQGLAAGDDARPGSTDRPRAGSTGAPAPASQAPDHAGAVNVYA